MVPLGSNWRVAVGDFLGDGREDVYLTDVNVGYTLRDFTLSDEGVDVWVDDNFRFDAAGTATSPPAAERPGAHVEATAPRPLG